MKKKTSSPPFVLPKDIMIDVPHRDVNIWLGEYLLASMVLNAWDEKLGFPDRVGRVGAVHEMEDGSGQIEFEAEWDDAPKAKRTKRSRKK